MSNNLFEDPWDTTKDPDSRKSAFLATPVMHVQRSASCLESPYAKKYILHRAVEQWNTSARWV